jgi:hypothetical protein
MNIKLLWLLTVFLLASMHFAEAQQQKKVRRIALLAFGTSEADRPGMCWPFFR